MKLLIEDDAGNIVGEISKVERLNLNDKSASDFLTGKIKQIITRKKRTVSLMPAVKVDD